MKSESWDDAVLKVTGRQSLLKVPGMGDVPGERRHVFQVLSFAFCSSPPLVHGAGDGSAPRGAAGSRQYTR